MFNLTCQILQALGQAGLIMNPEKMQYCQKSVQFAGFILEADKFRPSPKMFEAIENFKRPTNITEMRAWFGLVNQLSYVTKGDNATFSSFIEEGHKV